MTDRYARQRVLPTIGPEGQAKLAGASVLVVGAGGLGCPVLQYLSGAGIGRIRIIDHDRVEEGNLHRQALYQMADIGLPKAAAAEGALRRLNPTIEIESINERLSPDNVEDLVAGVDIVVDAADSLATTLVLSDACQRADKPLVSASVVGLTGYVGAFCGGGPSYRAVFPDMPLALQSCAVAGVLGPAVGVLGSLQAQFVIGLILALDRSPLGRLVTFDSGKLTFGGFDFTGAPEPNEARVPFIGPSAVTLADVVIDLRSLAEAHQSPFSGALRLCVEDIETIADYVPKSNRVVLCCRSGLRASRAAQRLATRGFENLALLTLGE
jgi:molybdopterin/thiamine biosynthesis adenylyltransferase